MIKSKEELLKFIADATGLNVTIKEEDTFEELDYDDLDKIELFMALEDEFNIVIEEEDAEKIFSVKEVIDCLKDKNILLD